MTCGSVHTLKNWLNGEDRRLPVRTDGTGKQTGGGLFSRGHLYKILSNPVYVGDIVHKGQRYSGQHEALIDLALWDAVQRQLAEQAQTFRNRRSGSDALLLGRLFDDRGNAMSPSYAQKGSIRYRYYVSQALLQGRKAETGSCPRVSAAGVEQVLLDYLRRLSFFPPNATDTDDQRPASGDRILVETHLEKVVVRKGKLSLLLKSKGDDGRELSGVEIDWSPSGGTRAREIIGIDRQTARPMRSEARERLLVALTKARRWLAEIITDPETTTQVIAAREGCSERAVRMNLNLAFLSPAIVRTVIDGALERGTGMSKMKDLPVSWIDQTKMASRRP
ncbi:hypothetical protein HB375_01415 [Microvirga sp. c23x22]|uniref:Recombinase domain-containing protein n=1 Tax=Microvirga terricola TaxID=2719797 RepID=A0ABX0V9B2_9HYPH|nr:hypothetical protein [Microvirga terricola]